MSPSRTRRTSTVVSVDFSADVSVDGVDVVSVGVGVLVDELEPELDGTDPPDDGAGAGAGAGADAGVVCVGAGVCVVVGVAVTVCVGVDDELVGVGDAVCVGVEVGDGDASRGCSRGASLTGPAVVPESGTGVGSSRLPDCEDSDFGESTPAHPALRTTATRATTTKTWRVSLRTRVHPGSPAIRVR
ncbi:hypothetical protein HSB1_46390 [Halogranum salarium B-1]|uniref:Uncharacterized protein n=1 Tax=Halogranum salarium B-1 TaxID=1210908 RepID=J2ZW60_9EURY|nr:hypothetical protein HSB1_46390 [Halogranum salarium B-1]